MIQFALVFITIAGFAADKAPDKPKGPKLLLSEATVEQLAALDHVDSGEAERIVALRTARGGTLDSVEQLRVIPGLDAATLHSLRSQTSVEIELPVRGSKKQYGNAEEVLSEFDWEPRVQQIQTWAQTYARTNPELVAGWLRASKSFATLPQLTVEYRHYDGWDQDFLYITDLQNAGSDPIAELEDAGVDADRRWTFKARWDLDELVMSSERIRIIQEAQDIVKLRDRVLSEVTRIYFERRRVQVEMLLSPKSDMMGQVTQELRLMELTANLDALTGGSFSQAVASAEGRATTGGG